MKIIEWHSTPPALRDATLHKYTLLDAISDAAASLPGDEFPRKQHLEVGIQFYKILETLPLFCGEPAGAEGELKQIESGVYHVGKIGRWKVLLTPGIPGAILKGYKTEIEIKIVP